jgi:hypothetical protein
MKMQSELIMQSHINRIAMELAQINPNDISLKAKIR